MAVDEPQGRPHAFRRQPAAGEPGLELDRLDELARELPDAPSRVAKARPAGCSTVMSATTDGKRGTGVKRTGSDGPGAAASSSSAT